MKRLLLLLPVLLALWPPAALRAQLQQKYTFKYDVAGMVFGEFRFSFEKRLSERRSFFTSAGYYDRENNVSQDETKPTSGLGELFNTFFTSNYNKFLYTSAGYYYRDIGDSIRERIRGPVIRVGLRQYFLTKNAPQGAYMYMGLNYSFFEGTYFNADYEQVAHAYIHKPGVSLAFGYQWLFGRKDNLALDVFGGMEYYYLIRNNDVGRDFTWGKIPSLILYCGVQIGIAWHKIWGHNQRN